jgi:glycosyltransferase involved in cell wall biosynthesis
LSVDTIAFVPPRYGTQVVGGAENLTRSLAEELRRRGWPVEVLTTCVLDHYTWANYFPPGEEIINGVTVRRFPVEEERDVRKVIQLEKRIHAGRKVSQRRQEAWISNVVTSEALRTYLDQHRGDYRAFVFAPYLFGTTYQGVNEVPERSYIIPCLHDEPYAYLDIFKRTVRSARAIMFNSEPEMMLARRLYGEDLRGRVVGMGFEPYNADGNRFRHKYAIKGDFLLYSGRREAGKNTPLLMRYLCNYLDRTDRDVSFVLTGTGQVQIPLSFRDRVIDLGFVDERDKLDAYAAATLLCHPSVNESFSIILMEAWLSQLPCLVHRDCAVTRYHVERSNGGLWFFDYPTFFEAVDLLLEQPDLRAEMGRRGREYVLDNYRWDDIERNFAAAIELGEGNQG